MTWYLHLHITDFAVAVEQWLNPGLKGLPVVVAAWHEGDARIIAASPEARNRGITTASRVEHTTRYAHAIVIPGDMSRYWNTSNKLLGKLQSWLPSEKGDTPGEFLLYPLTRDLDHLDAMIPSIVGSQYRFKAGVAGLPIVAWAAVSQARKNQICRVDPEQEAAFWDGISIAWIPWLGPRRKKDMLEMGIRTVGDFLSLGPAQTKAIWGPDAAKCWRWLMGEEHATSAPKTASRRYERVFPRTTYRRHQVLEGLDSACQEAASWLRRSGFTPSTLALAIRYPDGSGQRGRISLNTVINDRDFFRRGQVILQQIWIRRVRLDRLEVVFSAIRGTDNQLTLFDARNWERVRRLGSALDGVRNRYGYAAINYGSSLASAS